MPRFTKSKIRVALAFPAGLGFIERIVQGIVSFARGQGGWSFMRLPEVMGASPEWLRNWPGDGAFVLLTSEADAAIAATLPMPVVNLASHLDKVAVPSVTVDQRAIGEAAARHFLDRRFHRFGFYGLEGKTYSRERERGFTETLTKAGLGCSVLKATNLAENPGRWVDQQAQLVAWLRQIKTPAAIMAVTDLRANMVIEACHKMGRRVPDDFAVIGVDNDPVACGFCRPPLSSVSRNDYEVGIAAARLLDALMRGNPAPDSPIMLPPDRVVARTSTECHGIDDPEIAAVVRMVRTRLNEPFGVEEMLAHTTLSRRRLEQRFYQAMDCTPSVFINEQRVNRAKQLLADPTDQSLTQIAAACGFTELRRFRIVFEKLTGQSPASFRLSV